MEINLGTLFKQIGPVAAVLLGMLFMYFNPTQESQFNENLISRLSNAENKADQCLNESIVIKNQLKDMQFRFTIMRGSQESLPWPSWMKDGSGKVLFANSAYEKTYLKPLGYELSDYVGFRDEAVFSDITAQSFRANDLLVFESGIIIEVTEMVDSPGGEAQPVQVYKYPIKVRDVVVAVGGMTIPAKVL